MLRGVADPGVLIAALISPGGTPAELVRRWLAGELQLICSPKLLAEFGAVTERPKFREWFSEADARDFGILLSDVAEIHEDGEIDVAPTGDPADDYLVALAVNSHADCLITGGRGLLAHEPSPVRIVTPAQALRALDQLPG